MPLSERKLAQMFGKTSRRWACNGMTEARRTSSRAFADSRLTPGLSSAERPLLALEIALHIAVLSESSWCAPIRPTRLLPVLFHLRTLERYEQEWMNLFEATCGPPHARVSRSRPGCAAPCCGLPPVCHDSGLRRQPGFSGGARALRYVARAPRARRLLRSRCCFHAERMAALRAA